MFIHLSLALLPAVACAFQFVNQNAKALNLTVVRSPGGENVTVSYKEPVGACKTAFDTQKQYTGWVNVPGDYPANLFFWFVESRQPTKNLTIWMNGGPGSSSLIGFFAGNGPCEIVEKGLDHYDTIASDWGWDRASNMLFIDQPNQVGLSYDVPTNVTRDLLHDDMYMPPRMGNNSQPSWSYMNGTYPSMNETQTANTTQLAGMAVWHMVQGFLSAFPQYQPPENESVGINLFLESYGGRYGPIFADMWEEQNEKRNSGELDANKTLELHLTSLGIVNGCVDRELQLPLDPVFANQNTYGYKAITDEEAKFYVDKYNADDGCGALLRQCVSMAREQDPNDSGAITDVNDICSFASNTCFEIERPYYSAGRSPYDLGAPYQDPSPSMRFIEYLNQAKVQQAIGARTNYTLTSQAVFSVFGETGDIARGNTISRLADLVNRGIRVGLIYGDRDYICNWLGGEAVSLGIAQQAGGEYTAKFPGAGYAPIIVNSSYIGGVVRQFGNLSFSRIYQAGHSVAWYQPETAFQVFARILLGKSLSTGTDIDLSTFNTTGPANATATAKLPAMTTPTCYIRVFRETCDDDAFALAQRDEGVVINGVLYSSSGDWPLASKTGSPTSETGSSSSTPTLTGVYTATNTPEDSASALSRPGLLWALTILSTVVLHSQWT